VGRRRIRVTIEEAQAALEKLKERYGKLCDYLGIDRSHCDRKLVTWREEMKRYIRMIELAMKVERHGS